mgnify:CR=1 FL=1
MKNFIHSVLIGLSVALAMSTISCNKDNSTDVPANTTPPNTPSCSTDHGGGFDLDHETLTKAIIYDDNHNPCNDSVWELYWLVDPE